jgi:hypothetical protein
MSLWLALATIIHQMMETAAKNWEDIAKYLGQLLDISKPKGLHIEDENFSEFGNVLWVIDKLHEILPMVHDSIEQWDLFQAGNSRMRRTTQNNPLTKQKHYNYGDIVEPEDMLKIRLDSKLKELDIARDRLKNCEEEFKELSDRSRSLNDKVSRKQLSISHPRLT